MQTWYQKYKDQGFMVITLITENYNDEAPDQAELNLWADEYGQTFPVLSDAELYVHNFAGGKPNPSLPIHNLLMPNAVLQTVNGDITEADIEAALDKAALDKAAKP